MVLGLYNVNRLGSRFLGVKGKEKAVLNDLLAGLGIDLHVAGIIAEINLAFLYRVGHHIGPQILHAHTLIQKDVKEAFGFGIVRKL